MPVPSDTHARLSDLIGLIYDTASRPGLWPQLLDRLSAFLDRPGTPADGDGAEPMLALLAPHFVRAHDMQRRLAESDAARDLLDGVLDRLPLGMAVVRGDGAVLCINAALQALTQQNGALAQEAGRLVSRPRELLAGTLDLAQSGAGELPLRLGQTGMAGAVSLWISRLGPANGSPLFLVMAAGPASRALSQEGLCALFGLTPAEARVTQQITLGRSLDEIAVGLSVSLNTVKTHLKRVFSKVGVRRQPELLQAIYSSPLWLQAPPAPAPAALPSPFAAQPVAPYALAAAPGQNGADGLGLRLADGRWLAYSDSGPADGRPVLLMHGLAGSRFLRHPDDGVLHRLRLRLIVPERPGSGDSDPLPTRSIADWAADMAALVGQLRLGRYSLLGYSAGAPYALAVALADPVRVEQLGLVAAMPPIERIDDLGAYAPSLRMSLMLARHAPALLPPLLRGTVKSVRADVYRHLEQTLDSATEADRLALADPRLRASYAQGLLASVRRGEQDLVTELLLLARPWELDLSRLQPPVRLWHGEGDGMVAIEAAHKLAERLPRARVLPLPEAGHYALYSHWTRILAELVGG
ncbi:alpha/beta fold hydrolase [Derxia lacustris]|uniref:alpha/beta fold hydrolase n=1 Tax=Derxia lacustris TaxID=764842 RepID=UPI000A175A64|nr:alpha/beta fold hydrolase [Derxia lacustris]